MTENNQFEFPEVLADAICSFAHGFGLNSSAATLVLLQMAGAVAGPSVQVRTPDLMDLTPAFDMGCVHDGRAIVPGAVVAALDGALLEMQDAVVAQETSDRRQQVDKMRELESLNTALIAEIREKEEWAAGRHPPIIARSVMEEMSAEGRQWADRINSIRELPQLRERLANVQDQLLNSIIAVHSGVFRMNNGWRGFAEAGPQTLDGHFLQIADAGSLLAETTSKSNPLKACTELLLRSRSESPISGFDLKDNGYRACLHLFGSDHEFSTLLRHPRIKLLGMLKSLVYCAADADQPADVDALADFGNSKWHGFIARQFRIRATGARTRLMFDRDGTAAYFSFREWCREFNFQLPVEKRVFFLRWPELMIRIATSLTVIAEDIDGGVLKLPYLESAAAFLKDYAGQLAAILGRLTHDKPDITRIDEGVKKLVQRLHEKGPQTLRQLARSIHGQNYNVIDGRLFEAIRRGQVVQSDGRYYAACVSVNASTEPSVTKNGGGVAA